MGEQTRQPAGLGKLFCCPAEEFERLGMAAPMQEIHMAEPARLTSGILTCKDGDARPEHGWPSPISFHAVAKAEPDEVLQQLLQGAQTFDVIIQPKLPRMPRKMKKAYRTGLCYRRDTKWKRKVRAYIRRSIYRLPDAEIVVTREQMGVIEVTIKGGSLQSNPDAVVSVSGKDIGEKMAAFARRKQAKLEAL